MAFPGAGPASQDHVLGGVQELASMKLPDEGLVDLAGGEVEARQVLVSREARCLHVIGPSRDIPAGCTAGQWMDRTSRSAISAFSSCDRMGAVPEARLQRDRLERRRTLFHEVMDGSRQRRAFSTTPCLASSDCGA